MADWGYRFDPMAGTLTLTPSKATLDILRPAMTLETDLADAVSEYEQQRAKFAADQEKSKADRAAQAKKTAAFSEWNPVEMKLVEETPDGPPASGVPVLFSSTTKGSDFPQVTGTSDENGVFRLERVRYGNYMLAGGISGSKASGAWSLPLAVLPGEGLTKTIVIPKTPVLQEVKLRVNWPEEFRKYDLLLSASLGTFERTVIQPDKSELRVRLDHTQLKGDDTLMGFVDANGSVVTFRTVPRAMDSGVVVRPGEFTPHPGVQWPGLRVEIICVWPLCASVGLGLAEVAQDGAAEE